MKKVSVLIIEDEKALLETLKIKLSQEGFRVNTSMDGKEGVLKAKEIKPDLILLDLLLPKVTGEEVLAVIKKDPNLKKAAVIVISNSGQPVEINKILALGADDYIVKADFSIDEILERVYNTLEKKQGRVEVLLAEDDDSLRMLLWQKMRIEKIKIVTALGGENALKNVLELKPKVFVLDLLLPGISGLEILENLQNNKGFDADKTKIIVLSNYSGEEDNPIIQEMTKGYFIKSNIDIDKVVEQVKVLMKS